VRRALISINAVIATTAFSFIGGSELQVRIATDYHELDSPRAKILTSCVAYPGAIETIKTLHFTSVSIVATTK
jgi:hypothetical protein